MTWPTLKPSITRDRTKNVADEIERAAGGLKDEILGSGSVHGASHSNPELLEPSADFIAVTPVIEKPGFVESELELTGDA